MSTATSTHSQAPQPAPKPNPAIVAFWLDIMTAYEALQRTRAAQQQPTDTTPAPRREATAK